MLNTPDQKAKIRAYMAAIRRDQRKPEARAFPKYSQGMTAGEYIRRFNALNCGQYRTRITLDFDPETLVNESQTLDPLTPEVIEEVIE